jgi:hypothetical protein
MADGLWWIDMPAAMGSRGYERSSMPVLRLGVSAEIPMQTQASPRFAARSCGWLRRLVPGRRQDS